MIKAKARIGELFYICVSQQYRWYMVIEAKWEDLQRTKPPRDIFTHFAYYFQLNLDETYSLCNEGDLKVLRSKDKPHHEKIEVTQGFQ